MGLQNRKLLPYKNESFKLKTKKPTITPIKKLRMQIETIRANVIGCLTLADVTTTRNIHMTYFGTGCIFHYDDSFPLNSGKGFKESDIPNFTGSYYSYTKAMVESLIKEYPNVLTLRVRMPIVADLVYPRNFIAKIIKYDKVVDIPNSMTVIPELLPMAVEMAKRGLTGIMNYTNPGAVSHNEILQVICLLVFCKVLFWRALGFFNIKDLCFFVAVCSIADV